MKEVSQTLKNNVSTLLGFLVMLFSFGCYFFDWPQNRDVLINALEFGVGVVLVFMPMEKIAGDIWDILKNKLSGKG